MMKTQIYLAVYFYFLSSCILFFIEIPSAKAQSAISQQRSEVAQLLHNTKNRSVGFQENKGQWKENSNTLYRLQAKQAQVQFLDKEISFGVLKNEAEDLPSPLVNGANAEENNIAETLCGYVFNMRFVNPSGKMCVHPQHEQSQFSRYISSKSNIKAAHYQEIWYESVFENIDARFYEKKSGELEYDFIVYPSGKVEDIKFALDGISQTRIAANGNLEMEMPYGTLQKSAPYTYQMVQGKKVHIPSAFKINRDKSIGFTILGNYDKSLPLIIDPTALQWSTYLGGSYGETIRDIKVDDNGFIYVTGHTRSIDFPTTAGVEQPNMTANAEIYVTKLSPDGNSIIWSTYLGGMQYDRAYGLGVNSAGEVYIGGTVARVTGQPLGFPVTSGAAQETQGGTAAGSDRDGVVAKFNADGTLQWATYWGGSGNDRIYDLAIDPAGNAYVTGYTSSKDFPVSSGAYQIVNQDLGLVGDAFVASFSSSGAMRYSTLLGGTDGDKGFAIEVNSAGEAYVTGITGSLYSANPADNFDTTPNAFQPTTTSTDMQETVDAFVTKINATGTGLIYSTLIGGNGLDVGFDIALNSAGNAYIVGIIRTVLNGATYFPTTQGSFFTQPVQSQAALFALELNDDGSDLVFSNLIMDRNLTFEPALAVDEYGTIHITGQLDIFDRNLPTTPDAFQSDFSKYVNSEGFYLNLAPSGTELLYGTYLGGTYTEVGINISSLNSDPLFSTGITAKNCKVYVAGTTQSNDFPVTPTAYADDGVTLLSGYDTTYGGATPGSLGYSDGGDGTITVFNDPISTDNTLTPFANGTTFCKNGAIDPIDGNNVNDLLNLPDILRGSVLSPYPTTAQVKYQWQTAPTSSGTWTNIPGATTEDFITSYNTTTGSRWYRRIVLPANPYAQCIADTSSAVEVVINSNTATVAKAGGPYTFCGGEIITIGEAITPSPDGDFAPYTYSWTPTTNLLGTTSGTFTDPTFVPSVQTNTNVDAVYTLEVQDSRGCTSISQAVVTVLKANAGPDTLYSCGATSLVIGPPPPANNTLTYSWTPSTGLSCTDCANPTVTTMPAVGSPQTYTLTVNGCTSSSDNIVVVNNSGIALPSSFPTLSICQGDSVTLGGGAVSDPAYTYQWTPGFNLLNNLQIDATVVAAYAPAPVNNFVYYLTTMDPATGCSKVTTQEVIVNKMPSATFDVDIPWCPENTYIGSQVTFGVPPQTGMGYTWEVNVYPSGAGTGVPSNTEALTYITADNIANPTFSIPGPTMGTGGLADVAYDMIYVRTSYNTNSPSCFRTDTARVHYSPGENCVPGGCSLNSDAENNAYCGSPTTLVRPIIIYSSNVNYTWSPIAGLSDSNTGLPLSGAGPHSASVIANPSVTTDYTLSATNVVTGWTCTVVIRVYAGPSSTPVVDFEDVSTCEGHPTLIGQNAIAGLTYSWAPPSGLNDTEISNPTASIPDDAEYYVTVTDPVTTCQVVDTVKVTIGKYNAFAGVDRTFCGTSGTIVDLGAPAEEGYSYQWLKPTIGLANPNSAQTKDTIYTTTEYVLEVTHIASGCTARDTLTMTAASIPPVEAGTDAYVCDGGTSVIGTPTPIGANFTYQWASSSPGAGLSPSQSTLAQPTVSPTGAGPWMYYVTVTEGGATAGDPSCEAIDSVKLTNPGLLTVPNTAGIPCSASGVSIGVTNIPLDPGNWSYSWSPNTYITPSSWIGAKSISVYPPVETTYHLIATAPGGCRYEFDITVPAANYAAELGDNLNLCKGDPNPTLSLQTPPPSGATVTWTAVFPTTNTSLLSATNIENPTFNLSTATPGYYNYKITVDYPTGCSTSDDITVYVHSVPDNAAGNDATTCIGGCTSIGTPALPNTSYLWTTVPFDAAKVAQISNVNAAQPTVCPDGTTTYQLTITDNSSGCSKIDYVVVTATIQPPTLEVIDTTICQNANGTASVDLNSLVTSYTGNLSFWYDESADMLPISAPPMAITSGTYFIKASLANGDCFVVKPVEVVINDLPNVVASATPTSCSPLGYANNGYISLSGFSSTDKYAINTTSAAANTNSYSAASAIPVNGIIRNNLANSTNPAGDVYYIRVINASGCYTDLTVTLPQVTCAVCPTLSAVTPNYELCAENTTTSISVQISGSKPDNVKFVYFTSPQTSPNMYSGGTLMGTVPTIASATDTTATLANVSLPTSSTEVIYYVYALVEPTPSEPSCRPFAELTITVFASPANTNVNDATNTCPENTVNLLNLQPAATSISGSSFEWHTDNDPLSPLVSTPDAVGAGTYYLFERTSDGCYNNGDAVIITISSCCAPVLCSPITITKN